MIKTTNLKIRLTEREEKGTRPEMVSKNQSYFLLLSLSSHHRGELICAVCYIVPQDFCSYVCLRHSMDSPLLFVFSYLCLNRLCLSLLYLLLLFFFFCHFSALSISFTVYSLDFLNTKCLKRAQNRCNPAICFTIMAKKTAFTTDMVMLCKRTLQR